MELNLGAGAQPGTGRPSWEAAAAAGASMEQADEEWAARDLSFVGRHPPGASGAPALVLLVPAELDIYNSQGYVVPASRLLTPSEVQLHGDIWERLLRAEGDPASGFSVNGSFKRWGDICHCRDTDTLSNC